MDIIGIALSVSKKYLLPAVKKIGISFISNAGKTSYEKLYSRFTKATESFEVALSKLSDTSDIKKFQKRVKCCRLGLNFFLKIHAVLEEILADYSAAVEDAESKLCNLTGEEIKEDEV